MIEDNNDFESYYEPPAKPRRGNGADAADEPLPKLIPIRTSELMGAPVPTREWRVRGWIPLDTTTLIQGDGGLGKTSLAQQLQTSCATELPWIGLPVEPCVSLGVYTEDKLRDLEIRQAAINAVYGCDYDQTSHMLWLPRAGEESELIVFDRVGTPTLTKFYWQVCEAALDYQAGLVTLDVAVDLYGGDEIKRRQVRAFIRSLNNLAERIRGSVVLTGHVSQSGIQSDGGHSGSTDWSNGVRSRLYLGTPRADKEEASPVDADARILTRKKANFAGIGDAIKLHWKDGVIVPDNIMPTYFRRPADELFLALLDEHNSANRRPLSESNNATNYAPRVFSNLPDRERENYRQADFQRAMETLFKSRKIVSVTYGRKGDERRKIVRNVDLNKDKKEDQQ
jgi:RecA-family ATPase